MTLAFYLKNSLKFLTASLLFSCLGEGNNNSFRNEDFLQGERLYVTLCQSCHQADGKGFKALYPPLANADYFEQNSASIACIIKYGLTGKITVNGQEYDQTMPGNESLNAEEIKSIILYLNNSWGKTGGDVSLDEVKTNLSNCRP